MKTYICDMCKKDEHKITETVRYLSVRRHPDMHLDLCPSCIEKFHAKAGKRITAVYVRESYRRRGIDLDLDTAQRLALQMR